MFGTDSYLPFVLVGVVLLAVIVFIIGRKRSDITLAHTTHMRPDSDKTLSQTICVKTSAGCTPIIQKGTALPNSFSDTFANQEDDQPAVLISIYQGESNMPEHNRLIGNFVLPIRQAPKGQSYVQVTIMVDASKKLTVIAKDLATGKMQEFPGGFVQ